MEQLNQLDTQLFYWINSHHCTVSDWVLWTLSQGWSWAIVIVAALSLLTLRIEARHWWVVLLGIGGCFLFADQISVHCLKDVVCRLRPCHALENVRMFRTHCGGQYGFISSHAANVFAVATYLVCRYRTDSTTAKRGNTTGEVSHSHSSRLSWRALLLYLWAILVCYSRPYLGKHYPGDVVCGAIVGLAIGGLVWFVSNKIEKKYQH